MLDAVMWLVVIHCVGDVYMVWYTCKSHDIHLTYTLN